MRLRIGKTVVVTLIDGTVLRARVTRSWQWRVVRLVDGQAITPQGNMPALGPILIPFRSIMVAQEVAVHG